MLLDLTTKPIIDVHGKMDRRSGRASRQRRVIFFSSLQGASVFSLQTRGPFPSPVCSYVGDQFITSPTNCNCFAPVASCYFWTRGRTESSERWCWSAHDRASELTGHSTRKQKWRSTKQKAVHKLFPADQATGTEAFRAGPSPGSSLLCSQHRAGEGSAHLLLAPGARGAALALALVTPKHARCRDCPKKNGPRGLRAGCLIRWGGSSGFKFQGL
jgi:hypothetical protein